MISIICINMYNNNNNNNTNNNTNNNNNNNNNKTSEMLLNHNMMLYCRKQNQQTTRLPHFRYKQVVKKTQPYNTTISLCYFRLIIKKECT